MRWNIDNILESKKTSSSNVYFVGLMGKSQFIPKRYGSEYRWTLASGCCTSKLFLFNIYLKLLFQKVLIYKDV